MAKGVVFVPSMGIESWRALLADPVKQWAVGYSANALARCWEAGDGFPREIRDALDTCPQLAGAEPLLVFPEWKVPLPGGVRASQNDAWVLARAQDHLISMAVEGKVSESFDRTIGEWSAGGSAGKDTRLRFLCEVLGLSFPPPALVRYQLLHRAASAVLEAERFCAKHAVMLVHSFSQSNEWWDDFREFASLFGPAPERGTLLTGTARGGLPLHMGWVTGQGDWLQPEPACTDTGRQGGTT
jgi:hypothetical protein